MSSNPAPECTPQTCTTYTNKCCCPPQLNQQGESNGISVVMPAVQVINVNGQDQKVSNPCYNTTLQKTFFTYKVILVCGARSIEFIRIPTCPNLEKDKFTVEEKIDSCGDFTSLTPIVIDQNNLLQISTNNRYNDGVCVTYRISYEGRLLVDTGGVIEVQASGVTQEQYEYGGSASPCGTDCFFVPGCVAGASLIINKTCARTIQNNAATLNYTVTITNDGIVINNNVMFRDRINFPAGQVTIGNVVVTTNINPSPAIPVTVNNTDGFIAIGDQINGTNLGNLNPNTSFIISYTVPVSANTCGDFEFINTAIASADGINLVSDTETCNILVSKVDVTKACESSGSIVTFTINYTKPELCTIPATNITLKDVMTIPQGLTVKFISDTISGCGSCTCSPLFTGSVSNQIITSNCTGITITPGASVTRTIVMELTNISVYNTPLIINNTASVVPNAQETNIILLSTAANSCLEVQMNIACTCCNG